MPAGTALERLAQVLAEHPCSPSSTRIPATLGDLRDLSARIERLTDMVVSAAALQSGELSRQEGEYVAEELQLVAADLTKTGPRYTQGASRKATSRPTT